MSKIAILTITNSGMNFGNRLQNYALQKVLERYADHVETIRSAKSIGRSAVLSDFRRLAKALLRSDEKRKNFSAFERQYIHYAPRIRFEGVNEAKFGKDYDAYVSGSDQVWNPHFPFNSSFEFGTFAPRGKRFSYAASFGVDRIPEEKKALYTGYLEEMELLSVREKTGVEIVRELTGREALLCVDPTMLLMPGEYERIEEKPKGCSVPEHYVLKYYLGNVPEEYEEDISEIAESMGLPVENLSETKGTKYYSCGPAQFLYLFRHADYVCTDSFHGAIFAILFHKEFTVYVRRDKDVPMNDRLKTLLSTFGLEGRVYGELSQKARMMEMDYSKADEILMTKRQEAAGYFEAMRKAWDYEPNK